MREFFIAAAATLALNAVSALLPPVNDVPRVVITSPNGRFERVEWADNDGWHRVVTDHVQGTVIIEEVTADEGATIAVGNLETMERHGYRASMRTRNGFNEWDRAVSLYPREH